MNKTRTTNEGVTVVQTALRSAPGSPYGQSGPVYSARGDKETGNDHEKRTWRERAHKNAAGNMVVPGVGFSHAIAAAAKHLGLQIPGKGKSTYTKHFERGLLVTDSLVLPEKVADLPEHWLFLPSDGVPGSGKRVWKCFPHVEKWEGVLEWMVLDPVLTEEVFTRVLVEAGRFIGIGFFRPQNRGWWGRFTVEDVQWGK